MAILDPPEPNGCSRPHPGHLLRLVRGPGPPAPGRCFGHANRAIRRDDRGGNRRAEAEAGEDVEATKLSPGSGTWHFSGAPFPGYQVGATLTVSGAMVFAVRITPGGLGKVEHEENPVQQ